MRTTTTRLDKKCGQSGIPDNAKCSKQTQAGGVPDHRKAVLKFGLGAAGASMGAAALGSLIGGRKAPTRPAKRLNPGTFKLRSAPSIPGKKETSLTKRLSEIRRKNKENFGRPEFRDLRAVGLKAERNIKRGSTAAEALKKAGTPRLLKRRRDIGSFYKDGHAKTKKVRDRMAKIMDSYKKRSY